MSNILENYKQFPRLTEVYEVVQTVQVVIEGSRVIRIEVLKDYCSSPVSYQVEYWELESAYLQPSYPRSDAPEGPVFKKEPDDKRIFHRGMFFPSVYAPTPEAALREALGFIGRKGG